MGNATADKNQSFSNDIGANNSADNATQDRRQDRISKKVIAKKLSDGRDHGGCVLSEFDVAIRHGQ